MAQPVDEVDLYWKVLLETKARSISMRKFRDEKRRRVLAVELVKAISSSSAIGVWAVWQQYPLVWGGIIAVSQVLDAAKNVLPVAKTHKAASELTAALEVISDDAEADWVDVSSGRLDDQAIAARIRKIRKLRTVAEHKCFPTGFEIHDKMAELARVETKAYFMASYGDA
jgi:hypothetical protein